MYTPFKTVLFLFSSCLFLSQLQHANGDYQIGIGRADCTGPSAEIVFMGYAKTGQKGCGLHLRQFSRAFIIDDGEKRVAFVTVDACMMTHGVRRQVLRLLNDRYGDLYTEKNLVLSGTHTHGAPAGFIMDLMYTIPNLGFCNETFTALTNGITRSIVRAHENMVSGQISIATGELLDSNINRSPASYLMNPEEERQQYEYDVDKELVQMKFTRSSDNKTIGAINWFPVHPTSMNNTNCHVTSDNVGYASILLENHMDPAALPGKGEFVGAFASTNLGDTSPNTKGPKCIDTGDDCDPIHSTCNGSSQFCIAFGPGNDMVESTEIIATNLFKKAKELIDNTVTTTQVTGPINFIHQYVFMPNETVTVTSDNGTTAEVSGCYPAMGYGFAAGTTDGPGEFDFVQATNTTNPFWNAVVSVLFPPTQEDIDCHAPKPILLNVGKVQFPYPWTPTIVATQILKLGNAYIAAVPGEFTTMSGRRLKNMLKNAILKNGGEEDSKVILAGLSNVYTNYIATPEEYTLQRYEGASTIFGPNTLRIYLKLYENLANALLKNDELDDGPTPEDFSDRLLSLIPPVLFDAAGPGTDFGDCLLQPPTSVNIGDTVTVKFVSGHPRNNVMHEKTFLSVEKLTDDQWATVATDANWDTKFTWHRTNILNGTSEVEIEWHIKQDKFDAGTYRIGHFGFYKHLFSDVYPYSGYTANFTVSS